MQGAVVEFHDQLGGVEFLSCPPLLAGQCDADINHFGADENSEGRGIGYFDCLISSSLALMALSKASKRLLN